MTGLRGKVKSNSRPTPVSYEVIVTYHEQAVIRRVHSPETTRNRKKQSMRCPYLTLSQDALSTQATYIRTCMRGGEQHN